jgi:hypothetical protein
MAISLKHLFTSAKADGPDSTLIQPSNWNAEHVLTMATARLLGRTTASAGAAEEISVGTGLTLSAGSLSVTASTYQPLDADLTAIAALVSAADRLPYFTGSGTAALATFTSAGRALVDDADAAAQRTTLGLGTAATLNVGTSANNVVQLDGTAQLPAVSGALLTNLPVTASSGRLLRAPQILTTGTSYTTPAGCNTIYVEAVGAGGGGGGVDGGNNSANAEGSGGGGAGGYSAKYFSVSPSTAYAYAIGAAGAGGLATAGNGSNGGNTTFTVGATTITASGGSGAIGVLGASSADGQVKTGAGGSGGSATNGDLNITGTGGSAGSGGANQAATPAAISASGGAGGSSFFGGGGVGGQNDASGSNGVFGGGGGGSANLNDETGHAGGNGGDGFIRIWEYS